MKTIEELIPALFTARFPKRRLELIEEFQTAASESERRQALSNLAKWVLRHVYGYGEVQDYPAPEQVEQDLVARVARLRELAKTNPIAGFALEEIPYEGKFAPAVDASASIEQFDQKWIDQELDAWHRALYQQAPVSRTPRELSESEADALVELADALLEVALRGEHIRDEFKEEFFAVMKTAMSGVFAPNALNNLLEILGVLYGLGIFQDPYIRLLMLKSWTFNLGDKDDSKEQQARLLVIEAVGGKVIETPRYATDRIELELTPDILLEMTPGVVNALKDELTTGRSVDALIMGWSDDAMLLAGETLREYSRIFSDYHDRSKWDWGTIETTTRNTALQVAELLAIARARNLGKSLLTQNETLSIRWEIDRSGGGGDDLGSLPKDIDLSLAFAVINQDYGFWSLEAAPGFRLGKYLEIARTAQRSGYHGLAEAVLAVWLLSEINVPAGKPSSLLDGVRIIVEWQPQSARLLKLMGQVANSLPESPVRLIAMRMAQDFHDGEDQPISVLVEKSFKADLGPALWLALPIGWKNNLIRLGVRQQKIGHDSFGADSSDVVDYFKLLEIEIRNKLEQIRSKAEDSGALRTVVAKLAPNLDLGFLDAQRLEAGPALMCLKRISKNNALCADLPDSFKKHFHLDGKAESIEKMLKLLMLRNRTAHGEILSLDEVNTARQMFRDPVLMRNWLEMLRPQQAKDSK